MSWSTSSVAFPPSCETRRGQARIGAFGKRGGVQFPHKGFPRPGQFVLQATARRQHASPAVLAEALDEGVALLERAHDLAQSDRLCRPRQPETPAGAALGGDETA